jgi:hypothetical protein
MPPRRPSRPRVYELSEIPEDTTYEEIRETLLRKFNTQLRKNPRAMQNLIKHMHINHCTILADQLYPGYQNDARSILIVQMIIEKTCKEFWEKLEAKEGSSQEPLPQRTPSAHSPEQTRENPRTKGQSGTPYDLRSIMGEIRDQERKKPSKTLPWWKRLPFLRGWLKDND